MIVQFTNMPTFEEVLEELKRIPKSISVPFASDRKIFEAKCITNNQPFIFMIESLSVCRRDRDSNSFWLLDVYFKFNLCHRANSWEKLESLRYFLKDRAEFERPDRRCADFLESLILNPENE